MRKEVNLDLATRLINHGPVVLVTSLYEGRRGVTPVAWNMPISKKPPQVALEIGQKHFIYECILKSKNFVINIPSASFAKDIIKCGSCSGREVDKFEITSFTPEESKLVESPRIKEALAVLECVLIEDKHLIEEYGIIPADVKYAEALEEAFTDHWTLEKEDFFTIHHLGNKTFCTPNKNIIDLR